MKKSAISLALGAGLLAASAHAAPVEYVKVCSLYGASFHYIPGTDTCLNTSTGDARVQTEGGTWRSLLPYPEGKWTTQPTFECGLARPVNIGTFSSTDFTPNAWNRKQTQSVSVTMKPGEFVSKVTMSGGFYDPRIPARHGTNNTDGLCVRSVDPYVKESLGNGTFHNPPFGNGMLPVGCVANSRIVGMPAAYTISATSAYPSIDTYFTDANSSVAGPYPYGTRLVVTTDFGSSSFLQLTYFDANAQVNKPLAGKLSVSVCVEQGINQANPGGR